MIFGYSVSVFAAYHYYTKLNEKEVVSGEEFRRLLSELDTRFAFLESRLDQIDMKIENINRVSLFSRKRLPEKSLQRDLQTTTTNNHNSSVVSQL